jgi:hypothetical protein
MVRFLKWETRQDFTLEHLPVTSLQAEKSSCVNYLFLHVLHNPKEMFNVPSGRFESQAEIVIAIKQGIIVAVTSYDTSLLYTRVCVLAHNQGNNQTTATVRRGNNRGRDGG